MNIEQKKIKLRENEQVYYRTRSIIESFPDECLQYVQLFNGGNVLMLADISWRKALSHLRKVLGEYTLMYYYITDSNKLFVDKEQLVIWYHFSKVGVDGVDIAFYSNHIEKDLEYISKGKCTLVQETITETHTKVLCETKL